jgi:hypothetical protein
MPAIKVRGDRLWWFPVPVSEGATRTGVYQNMCVFAGNFEDLIANQSI